MTYKEKLRDPRWQKKRLSILQRDNWQCLVCGSKDKPLQVHHVVYLKIDPWDYNDDLLQTLCEGCHEERQEIVDNLVNALRINLKSVPTQRLSKVCQHVMDEAMEEISLG